jgi:NAD(P)-dependent dehydrogenase (short-subunit alcohol dehydrogenase family)
MKNQFELKNKNSLITGAAGLLGEQHARAILEVNGRVILVDINLASLKKLRERLLKDFSSDKIIIYKMDVTSEISIKKVIKILQKKKISVDILINNAALNPKPNLNSKKNNLENFLKDDWNNEINVGLTGYFLCIKYFGFQMAKQNKGVILNISSDLSVIAPDQRIYKNKNNKNNFIKPVTYSVIKTGITGLTRYVATYWAEKNIRCNTLSPGGVFDNQNKIFLNKLKNLIPLKRLAKKNEYKSTIQFLCSNASSYMTGQNIVIDGGRSIW